MSQLLKLLLKILLELGMAFMHRPKKNFQKIFVKNFFDFEF